MCGITFSFELGYTDEISVYDTLEELKKKHWYYKECGVVEIETDGAPEDYTSYAWLVPMNLLYDTSGDDPDLKKT